MLVNTGSLKVESIDLKNLKNLDATPTKVSADIVINFTPSSVAGVLKPITVASQNFNLTGANITSCLGMAGSDKMCTNLGGTWNGTNCKLNITAGVNTSEACAATYGTGWTWNGSACVPPVVENSNQQVITNSLANQASVPLCHGNQTTSPTCSSPDTKKFDCPPGYYVYGFDCTGDCGTNKMTVKCAKVQKS